MNNTTIAVFNNKIFFEIINEVKLFSKYSIKHYEDLELCIKNSKEHNQLVVFFEGSVHKAQVLNFPIIFVSKSLKKKIIISSSIQEQLKLPFTIIDFEKKVISLFSKNEFRKNSLINLGDYIIDKNERKIKKNNLELQLSEKEVDFLILFTESKIPINRNFVLKNVWKYSEDSETHTVETHIHRLRKKILQKFGDKNFIKNNSKGYYI
tara:strand:+ start:521 stop:1144 length:624 start_codon:yes stop_codon:yes gene_type:complete